MSESFESIIDGQFPPHLDRWYELRMDEYLPLIEPESDVARLAIDLYEISGEAHDSFRQARREGGDVEAARVVKLEASERWSMFQQLYYRIWSRLSGLDKEERSRLYSQIVSEACDEAIAHVSQPAYCPKDRSGLCGLAREASNLYQTEPIIHFTHLDAFERKALGE